MGIIYRIRSPSGKIYIGQTKQRLSKRIQQHKLAASQSGNSQHCRVIGRAIYKYGFNNMLIDILEECKDEDLDERETILIKTHNSMSPYGYNLVSGGNGKKSWSLESRKRSREAKLKACAKNFPDYPDLELPDYVIRWQRSGTSKGKIYSYKGYAVRNHPKCKHKFFAKVTTFEECLQDAKNYIAGLDNNEIKPVEKEILPDGIIRRRSGKYDGYEATFNNEKKRFSRKPEKLKEALDCAIKWLADKKK